MSAREPAAPEQQRPRAARVAIALGALHYVNNDVLTGPVLPDETIVVPPGSALEAQIDADDASAVWASEKETVVACPGKIGGTLCARPLRKNAVRASPVKSDAVYRALKNFVLRHNDQQFSFRTGERIDLEPSALETVVPGLLPGTVQRTPEVLHLVTCRHCGPVLVPLPPEDE